MKPITQERIFKALENARHQTWVVNKRAKEIEELVMLGSMHGLKLRIGASVQGESAKVKLECTYAGFDPYDPDTPKKVIAEWHKILERYWERRRKVLDLQEKYSINCVLG